VSPDAEALRTVRRFQSEADEFRETPEPRWARLTVFALVGFLAAGVALMFVARIDRVVTTESGKIVSTVGVSVYQSLDPAIVKSIDVKEGDVVSAGQQLATLDPTFAEADVKQIAQQIASLSTQIIRYEAELAGERPDFGRNDDPDYKRYATLQANAYSQQIAQYKAQLASFDAKIDETRATIAKYDADEARYRDREDVAKQIEAIRTKLAASGSGSKLDMLMSQDQRFELVRSLDYSHNSLIEAQHTLASLTADREAFMRQWASQLSSDLLTARNNLDIANAQFEKATKHQDLVRLTAKEDSVVLTVQKLSVGSVLKQGDSLLTMMPLDTPLEAEVLISSRDIGFVRPGDPCTLKIGAFNYMEHGTAEGSLRWISDNAFTTDDDGRIVPPYYRARCSLDRMRFRDMPANFRLIPGMTLQADLKVGTRSVAMYLLGGFLRGFGEAMREP